MFTFPDTSILGNMLSRMHFFPIMYSRVHSCPFKDASVPKLVNKGIYRCILRCILQPCSQVGDLMLSRIHPLPTMGIKVHVITYPDTSILGNVLEGTLICLYIVSLPNNILKGTIQ
jgi:hypothetical protein